MLPSAKAHAECGTTVNELAWGREQARSREGFVVSCASLIVLTVHVPFVFILNKGVSARFARVFVVDHDDLLNVTVHFKLSAQLRLRCVVVLWQGVHTKHEN